MRIVAGSQANQVSWAQLFALLTCALLPAGCSAWKETSADPFQLPAARMSPDSVGIELTFVRLPVEQVQFNQRLWQQLDEQIIPVDQRLHLNSNGFRCGLAGMQLPEVLRELLEEQTDAADLEQAANSKMDVLAQNQLVQRRSGQRWEIVTGPPRPQMPVLYKDATASKVSGKPFLDAQCVLAGRPFPLGDGSVRLELTPEIHHGPPTKQQWVADERTFQLLVGGRDREVYPQLLMEVAFRPGQTLVIGCTPDLKGLGQNFFVEEGRGDAQQKLLLLRLAQVQRDELFETQSAQ